MNPLREPLVHFLLIGAALVGVAQLRPGDEDARRIVVDDELVSRLAAAHRSQFGSPPDERTLSELIDRHVEEETLYREGLALGLDREDLVVRRRIVQKMRFLVEDAAEVDPPDEAAIDAWYRAHAGRYVVPGTFAFTHVYFSTDGSSEDATRARAEAALLELHDGAETGKAARGDRFPGPDAYAAASLEDLRRAFGESDFSRRLSDAPVGAWSGPLRSGFGWHLVRVHARRPPRPVPLEEAHDQVVQDLLAARRAERERDGLDRLRARYSVVRSAPRHEGDPARGGSDPGGPDHSR
ncbi:MAG: peptidylprolyl isomerase [Myxococcota bacterium]